MWLSDLEKVLEKQVAAISDRPKATRYPIGLEAALRVISKDPEHPKGDAIRRRLDLLDQARDDVDLQQEVLAQCKADPCYWINNWVWTYDPRRKPSSMPFDLFPKQSEFLRWLEKRIDLEEDGIVEKSRDAGLSWLCVAFAVWQWLYVPGSKITFGSRKADLVDSLGDPDSLFEKVRLLLKNLPPWMLPKSYSDKELQFTNRDHGSTITGEAGDQMGRGGRSTLYFLDEFAFVERAHVVDGAVSENSEVKIYVSTPNGSGNTFAKKRHSGQYPVFRIHWTDDPRKSQEWYEKRKAKLDPVILAQEIDIDYAASVEGVCIPNAWVMAAVGLKLPPRGPRVAGLDVANNGKNKNVLIMAQGPVVLAIEHWAEGNTTQTAWKVKELGLQHHIKHLNYDADGVGAGVTGTLKSSDSLPFTTQGINGSGATSETTWPEFDDRTSKEMFKNLRAELWWLLRRRFEKTYEHVNKLAEYPLEELISIPNHAELIAQLSQPLRRFNDAGKIVIESKDEMLKRGIESPDFADTLAYCFHRSVVANLSWLAKA